MGSPKFSLDTNDLKKIGKGALIAAGAAVCTYLISALPGINLGASTPLVVAVLGVVLNSAQKFFKDSSAQ